MLDLRTYGALLNEELDFIIEYGIDGSMAVRYDRRSYI